MSTASADDTQPLYGAIDRRRTSSSREPGPIKTSYTSAVIAVISLIAIGASTGCVVYTVLYYRLEARTPLVWPAPSFTRLGVYYRAAAAADHEQCSTIGRDVMLMGGNAVDAAIAMSVCIGVTDAHSAGLGGGHLMTIYNATTKRCSAIDARETAPRLAHRDMYADASSTYGYSSIGVPGTVHGLRTAFDLYGGGVVTWAQLLQPTIDYMRRGVPISPALASSLRTTDLTSAASMLKIYLNAMSGRPFEAGEVMKDGYGMLADTLQILADSADPIFDFYNTTDGQIGKQIGAEFDNEASFIRSSDVSAYTSIVRPYDTMMCANVSAVHYMCGPPPPSGAAIAAAIVGILAGDVPAEEYYHRFVEASKYAYAARAQLGDRAFVENATALADYVTSEAFAASVRAHMLPEAQDYFAYYEPLIEAFGTGSIHRTHETERVDHGTSHLSVVDARGNAVALTMTINTIFGSKMRSPTTGIIWNNEMDDFSSPNQTNSFGFEPSPANYIVAGKRPQSSMSPMIVVDRRTLDVHAVVGAAGGSHIISGVAYVASRMLHLGDTVKQAVDAPRLHNQLRPPVTHVERGLPTPIVEQLRARGQTVVVSAPGGAVVTAIHRTACDTDVDGYCNADGDGQIWRANSDYRKKSTSDSAGY